MNVRSIAAEDQTCFVVVIGSGPDGNKAAITAAHLAGGNCLNQGYGFFKDMNYSHPSWREEIETAIDPYPTAFSKSDKILFRPAICAGHEFLLRT